MKRVTRRQTKSWLAPIRKCFADLKTGEVDAINDYAATRLDNDDTYARIDFCIAGFRGLLDRLCPQIDVAQLEDIQTKLANQELLTVAEIDSVLTVLHQCEDALIRLPYATIKSAVLTEQIAIEMDVAELMDREAA